jgi:uncharacterized protein (TIGR03663 family)
MSKTAYRGLFLAALLAAAALRFGRLDLRPMHHDEANQAVKFGALLETGAYTYDKADHHGPTLYYLTLPAAWARGQRTLASLDEKTLRAVPALFGVGLVALFLLLGKGIGRRAAAAAALIAAVSPAMAYYSRSYIQEILFAFFAWGFLISLGRLVLKPGGWKAAAAGILAGLAYATKETSVLVFGAAAAGLFVAWILSRRGAETRLPIPRPIHWLIAVGSAAATAFLFFSSFFRNPRGIIDSLTAFKDYAVRGTEAGLHSQPWSYYLKTLAWTRSEGVLWTEALILVLAAIGITAAFIRRRKNTKPSQTTAASAVPADPVRTTGIVGAASPKSSEFVPTDPAATSRGFWLPYLAIATIFMAIAFSALSYKTPWNMVTFLAGFCILAGVGADALLRAVRLPAARTALALLLFLGLTHLGRQSLAANFRYPADPRNPYVYAQTSPDFMRLVGRVRDLAGFHRDGKAMLVKVVAPPDEQWPLPWYLRDFKRVGYWTTPAASRASPW